jgi:ferredoxin-nitrite reductase
MGVLVAENVPKEKVLYHVKAMVTLFLEYGNYENRAKARTRYMQDVLGDNYRAEYEKKLAAAMEEDLDIVVEETVLDKKGDGVAVAGKRVIPQKQEGLYAVLYHPIGGSPDPKKLGEILDVIQEMDKVELRLTPEEAVYIVNCTGEEAKKVLAVTEDGAKTELESSVACIGAAICQVGVRDSQGLLAKIVEASQEWGFADGVLPKLHISGCPSSCGTHQIGRIGFRGGAKKIDGKSEPSYLLCVNGREEAGKERFGEQLGTILEKDIPTFLKALGDEIAGAGMDFESWYQKDPDRLAAIAAPYL